MQDKNIYPTFNAVDNFHKLRAATKEAILAKQARAQEAEIESDLCTRAGIEVITQIRTGLDAIATNAPIKFLIETPGFLGFFKKSRVIGLEVKRPSPLNLVVQVRHKVFIHCACLCVGETPVLFVRPLTHANHKHDCFWDWMTHQETYKQASVGCALTEMSKLIISYEHEPSYATL